MGKPLALLLIMIFPTLIFAQANQPVQNRPLVFRNATLIDMRSEKPRAGMTVLISDNRIAKIGRNIKIPKNAEVVDASGKFLMPGLWDNFTYTLNAVKEGFPYFEMMVAHGVTGVRDSGTHMDLAEAERLQNDIVAGRVLAPSLFYSGRYVNGANMSELALRDRPSFQSGNADEAVRHVETLARSGVDYISIGHYLPPEYVPAVAAAAKKFKLPVLSYVVYGYGKASDLGVNCIEHFADLDRSVSTMREEYFALYRDGRRNSMTTEESRAFIDRLIDSRDQPFYEATLRTLANNKTCVATNFAGFGLGSNKFDLTDLSRRRFKTKKQLEQLDAAIKELERKPGGKHTKGHLQNIYNLHKAGVPLLAGTQSAMSYASPGTWLHDELYYFVQAGLSPFEALKTATVNPARFMRREKDLGTIETGKLADLVLLDANPLTDISNTRKINAVVVNGRYLSRESLDKMLSDIEAKAKMQ
jgi:imidazolonepropionase-like amidohydrolase